MNRTFKNILEITQIEAAQGRLDELDRFLDVTRAFSLKCSGHLRILTNLVNNLVESEDWLELGETDLRLPDRRRFEQQVVRVEVEERETEAMAVLGGLRNENEKLMQLIEKGEDNTNYLRDLMGKLLDGISQKESRSELIRETQHECLHLHCCNEGSLSDAALGNSNLRGGNAEEPRLRAICAELVAANERLKAEVARLRQREASEGQGLGEMLKKVLEIKADAEAQLEEKDRALEEAQLALEAAEEARARAESEATALRLQARKIPSAPRLPPPAPAPAAAKDRVVLDFLKACYNQASYIEEFIMVAQ